MVLKKGRIVFLGVVVFLLIGSMVIFLFTNKKVTTFQLESRVSNISHVKIGEDSDFQTIGWIRVQGTNIDYPIIQSENLDSEFPVEIDSFSWSLNQNDQFHNRIFIMGHNIFNLSSTPKKDDNRFHRFEELMSFVYYDFAKENQYIQLTLEGKDYIYKIFSVDFLKSAEIYGFPSNDDYSRNQMKQYIGIRKLLKKVVDILANGFALYIVMYIEIRDKLSFGNMKLKNSVTSLMMMVAKLDVSSRLRSATVLESLMTATS